jgi:hypothetical protein
LVALLRSDGRGLNSVQILAFLRVAASMTGNATFDEAADDLKQTYGYGINAVNAKITTPQVRWRERPREITYLVTPRS